MWIRSKANFVPIPCMEMLYTQAFFMTYNNAPSIECLRKIASTNITHEPLTKTSVEIFWSVWTVLLAFEKRQNDILLFLPSFLYSHFSWRPLLVSHLPMKEETINRRVIYHCQELSRTFVVVREKAISHYGISFVMQCIYSSQFYFQSLLSGETVASELLFVT